MMNITWITGWAIAPEAVKELAMQHLPEQQHHIHSPTPQTLKQLTAQGSGDLLIGHSLGAFLVLNNPAITARFSKTILISPFVDYKKESKCGSRVSLTQLKMLKRWLSNKPLPAIYDFYARAKLGEGKLNDLPYAIDDLIWGIDVLINDAVDCVDLDNVLLYGGARDPLLDFSIMQPFLPKLEIVKQADHKLEDFINILVKHAL